MILPHRRADRLEERSIEDAARQRVAAAWDVTVTQLPGDSPVDWVLRRDYQLVGVAEFKNRQLSFRAATYGSIWVAESKRVALEQLHPNGYFIVRASLDDTLHFVYTPDLVEYPLVMQSDTEWVRMVPLDAWVPID